MTDYSCLKDIHVSEGTDTTKSDFTCLHGRKNTDKFSHHQKNRASNKESNGDHDSHGDHTFFTHIYDCMEGRKMPPKKADCSDHIRLAVDLTPVIYNIRRAKNEAYVIQNRLKWMQKSKSTPDLSKIGDEILFLEGFADSSTLDTRKCWHTYSRSRAHQRRRGDCPYCSRIRSNSAPNVQEKEETFARQSENLPRQKSGSQSDLRSSTRWRSEEDVEDHSKKVKTTYYKSRMNIDISGDSTAIRASDSQENETKAVVGDGDKERKTVREELSVRLESGEQCKTKSTSDLRYLCLVDPNDKDTVVFDDVEYNHAKGKSTALDLSSEVVSKQQEPTDIPKASPKVEREPSLNQKQSSTAGKLEENDKDKLQRKAVSSREQSEQERLNIRKVQTKTEEVQYTDQELSTTAAKSKELNEEDYRKARLSVTRRAQANQEQSDIHKVSTKTKEMQYKDQELSTLAAKSREHDKDKNRKSAFTRKAQETQEQSDMHKISTKTEEMLHKDQELSTTSAKSREKDKDIDRKAKATVSKRAGLEKLEKEEVVQQPLQELPDSSPSPSKALSSASLLLAKTEPTSKKDEFVSTKVEMPPPKKLDLKGYYSIENLFQNRSKWLSRSQDDLLEDDSQKKFSKDVGKKSSQQFSRSQEDHLDESSQKKLSNDGGKKTSQELSRRQEDLVDKVSQIKKFSRSQEDLLDIGTRKTFRKEKTKKTLLASPTRMRLSRSEENLISEDNSEKKPEIGPLTIDPSKFSATSVEVFREIPNVQANLVKERISLYESFVEENPSVEIRSKSLPRNMSKTGGDLRSRSLPRNVYEKFEGKVSQETVIKKSTAATRRSRGFSRRADFKKVKVPSSDQKKESKKEVYKPKVTEETPKKDVKNSSTSNDFKPSQVKQQLRNRRSGTTEQTSLESKPKAGTRETKETKKVVQTFSASKEVQPSKMKQHTRGKSPGKTEETSLELKTNLKAVTPILTNEKADNTVMLRKVRRSDKIPESSQGPKAVDDKQPQVKEKVEKLKYPRVEGDAFILTKIRTTQLMEDEEVDSKTKPAKNLTKGTNGLTTAVAAYALNSTEGKIVNAKPVWIDTGWPKKGELDGFYTAKYGWIEPQKPKTVQEGIFLAKMVWAASDSDRCQAESLID
ncbi:micronuclear linker histone polyprotein-like [Branchiostoma lanceolatum]|uniref:micronuclear linker histone polyprotein-like n=1 Tax=Branchiostoma lanceolatum TaxID=7740 RepID=UPI003453EBA9